MAWTRGASRSIRLIKLAGVVIRGWRRRGHPICAWCAQPIEYGEKWGNRQSGTIDHVVIYGDKDPRKNHIANLVPSCRACNSTRGVGSKLGYAKLFDRLTFWEVDADAQYREVERQLRSDIDRELAHEYAQRWYPIRYLYLLEQSRLRSLRRRHGANAEQRMRELDEIAEELASQVPF